MVSSVVISSMGNLISMRFEAKRSIAVVLQMLNRVRMQATEGSVNTDCEHFIINYFIHVFMSMLELNLNLCYYLDK